MIRSSFGLFFLSKFIHFTSCFHQNPLQLYCVVLFHDMPVRLPLPDVFKDRMASIGDELPQLTSTAVTRSLNDLHLPTWFALQTLTIAIRSACLHPLSLAASRKRVSDNSTTSAAVSSSNSKSTSVRSILMNVYAESERPDSKGARSRSLRNVYRGFGISVVGNVIGEMSCLLTVESVKEALLQGNDSPAYSVGVASAAAGACGDLVAIALTTPLSIVCDRQLTAGFGMARSNPYQSARKTFLSVWNGTAGTVPSGSRVSWRTGLHNVYAGAPANLALVPGAGVWWGSYCTIKVVMYDVLGPLLQSVSSSESMAGVPSGNSGVLAVFDRKWFFSPVDNPVINGISGVFASVFTALCFTPIAVLRTRLQTLTPAELDDYARQLSRRSFIPKWRIVTVARHLYRNDGLRGFYRGASVNVAMAIIDGLTFSTLYELNKLGSDKGLRSDISP